MTKMTWRKFGIILMAATTISGVLSLMNEALDALDDSDECDDECDEDDEDEDED